MGATGFGPGPLADRPRTFKGYNWTGPSGPGCELNLGARIQISFPSQEGVDIPRMPSPTKVLFNKCSRIDSPEESMRPSMPCHEFCDAPKPGGPLTTRQPVEYKWMSGYPTPL